MTTYNDQPSICHHPISANFPDYGYPKPETPAGRYVRSHFPVPTEQADLIASLAGLGSEVEAA